MNNLVGGKSSYDFSLYMTLDCLSISVILPISCLKVPHSRKHKEDGELSGTTFLQCEKGLKRITSYCLSQGKKACATEMLLDIREFTQGGVYWKGGNACSAVTAKLVLLLSQLLLRPGSFAQFNLSWAFHIFASKPCLWRQRRELGGCHTNVTFYEQDNCSKKVFFFLFWQALNPWPGSPCPPTPPPHSTEMDTANFCLRPALAAEPTRRETACALISKIFMSCFG